MKFAFRKRKFAQVRCDASHGKGASQRTTIGVSDSSLMDDFVVMEKLAIVSIDTCNLDSIGIKVALQCRYDSGSNDDLNEVIAAKNEANQKLSALIVGLEDKSYCCEELEATCLDLQLQLASDLIKIR
ncbi:hypothetical protein Tco_1324160 [Tanacetum coccineum]